MLFPGNAAHSPNMISCDLNQIDLDMSIYVKNYFMVLYFFLSNKFKLLVKGQSLNSAIHLVLDGWTSPIVSSYLGLVLGLVVVWLGRRSHEPKASGDDVNRLEELLARQRTTGAAE